MTPLGDNIRVLSKLRRRRDQALANLSEPLRLRLIAPSGSNPGELRMLTYVPPDLVAGAPLVVVLHGCTQNAAAYDHGSGWSVLAERHGFAVLFIEQQRSNNPQLCFNWFQPEDVTPGSGEVESIRQMVLQTVAAHGLDAGRVYITGLSAGGAMAAAMLATAPDLFAGGAIIAGLPYAAASNVMEAIGVMNDPRRRTTREWGDLVRAASPRAEHRPAVQIWQGMADDVVNPGNAQALVMQWTDALGLPLVPSRIETEDGATHDIWCLADGTVRMECWSVPGLRHGTPISPDAADDDEGVGVPAPHMLAGGIASTWHIARRWGLLGPVTARATARSPVSPPPPAPAKDTTLSLIERALKTAGLM